MKKLLYALGTMMLLGLITACVDPVNNVKVDNPNYDPIKDAVTTQFVINIAPADSQPKTKQSAEAVQIDRNFRGLGNATLFTTRISGALLGHNSDTLVDGKMIPWVLKGEEHLKATSYIPLSTALLAGAIDPNDSTGTVPKSRRVIEISIPRETNALLFYGEAVTGTDQDALNAYGGIDYTMGFDTDGKVDLATIGSSAKPRLPRWAQDATTGAYIVNTPSTKAQDFEEISTMIVCILNRLFKVGVNGSNGWDGTKVSGYMKKAGTEDQYWNTYNFGPDSVELHWADFKTCVDNSSDSPLNGIFGVAGTVKASQMEIILGTAYNAFVTMDPKELRSGAGPSVARQATDLYSVMNDALNSAAVNEQEEVAKVIIAEIVKGLSLFFDTTNPSSLTWKSIEDPAATTPGVRTILADKFKMYFPKLNSSTYTLQAFPFHFDLPMGATTLIGGGSDSTFCYNTQAISLVDMGGGTMSVYDYTYPPSITYYGNAPVRISKSNDLTQNKFPDGTARWEADSAWTNQGVWESGFGHVTSDTRGVAMAYNIQYGNAMLETHVKYGSTVSANNNKLVDNYGHIAGHSGEDDKEYSITEGSLALTGILIGGQPDAVGWTYMGVKGANYNKMVYDKAINEGTKTKEGSTWKYTLPIPSNYNPTVANYTVLYDNFDQDKYNSSEAQSDVYVALEFQNNLGQDFWGNANMVRNGGTFYILAKLPISAIDNDKWNNVKANYTKIQPPYKFGDQGVETLDVKRIFVQNCITKATFVIGKDSLKSAYVTVPDLRATKMSIGLSVDLQWRTGVDFGDIVLGN